MNLSQSLHARLIVFLIGQRESVGSGQHVGQRYPGRPSLRQLLHPPEIFSLWGLHAVASLINTSWQGMLHARAGLGTVRLPRIRDCDEIARTAHMM